MGIREQADAHYASIVIARWEAFTGQAAEKVSG
jgi:hypothetical protein